MYQHRRSTFVPTFILVSVPPWMSYLHRMFHKHTNIKKVKISELRFNGIKGYTSYFIQTSVLFTIISGTSEAGRTALPYFFKNLEHMVAFFANIQTY